MSLKALREEMAEQRRQEHVESERDRVRGLIGWLLACMFWSGLGILCLGWSMHTNDVTYGYVAFYAGLGIGNGGILFTVLAAHRWGERHGYW